MAHRTKIKLEVEFEVPGRKIDKNAKAEQYLDLGLSVRNKTENLKVRLLNVSEREVGVRRDPLRQESLKIINRTRRIMRAVVPEGIRIRCEYPSTVFDWPQSNTPPKLSDTHKLWVFKTQMGVQVPLSYNYKTNEMTYGMYITTQKGLGYWRKWNLNNVEELKSLTEFIEKTAK